MSVTLASMAAEVLIALGNRSDMSTLIGGWLNQAQRSLATTLAIRELEAAATTTLDPTATNPDIITAPLDFWAPRLLLNTSKSRMEIKLKEQDTVLKKLKTPAAAPQEYTLRGSTLILRPQPDAADVLELTYKIRVPDMTASVDMTLPDEFRPVVVFDAIVRGLLIDGQEERARLFDGQRDNELSRIGDQRGEELFGQVGGAQVQWSGIEGRR